MATSTPNPDPSTLPTHEVPAWESSTPKKSLFSSLNIKKPAFLNSSTTSSALTKETEENTEESQTEVKRISVGRWGGIRKSKKRLGMVIGAVVVLLIVVLGVGLGVGLGKKNSSKSQNLPLPTSKDIFTGDLTYYSPGPGYGACGYENSSTDAICAVSHLLWDSVSTSSNPNNNPLCGKMIRITRDDGSGRGNRSVDVEVVDRCTGCEPTDLDLSIKMFTALAEEGQGRVVGSWAWLN